MDALETFVTFLSVRQKAKSYFLRQPSIIFGPDMCRQCAAFDFSGQIARGSKMFRSWIRGRFPDCHRFGE